MSQKDTQQSQSETTTHYWGYRELSPSEIKHVGGGNENGSSETGTGSSETICDGFGTSYGGEGAPGDAGSGIRAGIGSFTWDGSN